MFRDTLGVKLYPALLPQVSLKARYTSATYEYECMNMNVNNLLCLTTGYAYDGCRPAQGTTHQLKVRRRGTSARA